MLEKILNGRFELIDGFDITLTAQYEDEVVITPRLVKGTLCKYISGDIDAYQLNLWAKFICKRPEYVVPGGDNDAINDYYEPMYYVIQKLSTPELDGEISKELVQEYLNEIEGLREPKDS